MSTRSTSFSKNTFNLAFILILALGLYGCVSAPPKTTTLQISIETPEPNKIRFRGKGEGAGMMFTSLMGPVGIAIGVAIDEGIGKDIEQTAQTENINIPNILKEEIEFAWKQTQVENQTETKGNNALAAISPLHIKIERYGFITARGDNDPVTAQLHISYITQYNAAANSNGLGSHGEGDSYDGKNKQKNNVHTIKYPDDFKDLALPTMPLDTVKKQAAVIEKMHREAAKMVAATILAPKK